MVKWLAQGACSQTHLLSESEGIIVQEGRRANGYGERVRKRKGEEEGEVGGTCYICDDIGLVGHCKVCLGGYLGHYWGSGGGGEARRRWKGRNIRSGSEEEGHSQRATFDHTIIIGSYKDRLAHPDHG